MGFLAFVGLGVFGSLVGNTELGTGVGLGVGIEEGIKILSEGFVVGPADEIAGLEDSDIEGPFVGLNGDTDGDRDGAVEGTLLGALVGGKLGLFDGDCEVGEAVGDVDGDPVAVVGRTDIEGESEIVGVVEGDREGDADGDSLGRDDGLKVGELVGLAVTFL